VVAAHELARMYDPSSTVVGGLKSTEVPRLDGGTSRCGETLLGLRAEGGTT
jgi:hypothetical protein